MDELGVAVLGFGVGRSHMRAYDQIPGVRLVVLCDVNEERLAQARQEFDGIATTSDVEEAVSRDDVHVVSVCTPDHLHYEHCLAALAHGKHILCEKPMTTSEPHAWDLVRRVKEADVRFAVGNVNRFVPQFAAINQFVEEGRLGELFFVESDYIHDMRNVYQRTPWRKDPVHPQNAWYGGGVHPMDLVRWVAGDVAEITLYANKCASAPEFPLPDTYISILKFANGCLGKVWETSAIRRVPAHVVNFNAYGSEGTMLANTLEMEAKLWLNWGVEGLADAQTLPFRRTIGHPVLDELTHLVDCIRNGATPLVDALEGAKTVATLAAGLRSLESGKPESVNSGP